MHLLFYNYKGWVLKVVSPNLIDVRVNLGFRIMHEIRVRLSDVDIENKSQNVLKDMTECLNLVVMNRRLVVSPSRPAFNGAIVLCYLYVVCLAPISELADCIESVVTVNDPNNNRYFLNVNSYMNLCSRYNYNIVQLEPLVNQLRLVNID